MDGISLELFVATLFLCAEFFEDGTLALACLEVAGMTRQLDPLVLAILESLDEWGPLNHVSNFAPSRGL